ncbi:MULTISPECIES: alpha-hydroxy acid oxidase [unclassified Caballeronia]|uniref:alpha-hydroxy acid oxidase n=1 Tax=unclassified Caballeronia TaxID=2646786 RepID=UPI0028654F4B|nr:MULTISPECIES: alpha-hydroxy acid oxidase [unclassified Caballeronia]MDR5738976.1 alpha-hydroxy acid oxidase [Caballeronia sp. LZ016]MDR5807464.1 alpha-hydroxy acid oxidase [Caballeronia sp. LZ019]
MQRRLYTGNDPRRAHSIEELRGMARRRVPNFCFEYVEGGSEDESTLRRNRDVFAEIAFRPRSLVDVSKRDIGIDLFGRRSNAPFMIGPTGFSGLLSHEGDIALASAAAAAGIPYILSNASTVALEHVVERAGGRIWMQVYMYRTRDFVAKLAERAKKADVEALVVTTDSAIYGKREWDLRNYARPLKLDMRNTFDVLTHPRWMMDVLWPHGMPRFANLGDLLPPGQDSVRGAASALAKELDPSLSWDDIRWLRDRWPGKLIVKGLIHPDDAARAVSLGADGIVLSNHGGRQLDGSVSAMEVLPEVVDAVKGRLAIMLDGGFRRGSDIVKAMALGADAVLLGRATTWGLGAGGRAGVDRAIEILKTEVDRVIGLLGVGSIAELDARYIEWSRIAPRSAARTRQDAPVELELQ